MESAIKDNWIQVRGLRCTRATVKALFIKQRGTESGPSPREHVAHGRATWNMVIRPARRDERRGLRRSLCVPHFANIHAPVRVSLKLHAHEAYAGMAARSYLWKNSSRRSVTLNCVTYSEYCKNMLYATRREYLKGIRGGVRVVHHRQIS